MQTHESIKKAAAFLLAVVLLFSAVPVTVHAADKEQEKENGYKNASAEVLPEQITVENRITFTGQISPHEELPDNGELFSWFVERELYGYDMALFGIAGRNSLNAEEQAVYDVLKQNIENVALAGGSTVFTLSDIPGLKMTWTN